MDLRGHPAPRQSFLRSSKNAEAFFHRFRGWVQVYKWSGNTVTIYVPPIVMAPRKKGRRKHAQQDARGFLHLSLELGSDDQMRGKRR